MVRLNSLSAEQRSACYAGIAALMDERIVSTHYKRKVWSAIWRSDEHHLFVNTRKAGVEDAHVIAVITLIGS